MKKTMPMVADRHFSMAVAADVLSRLGFQVLLVCATDPHEVIGHMAQVPSEAILSDMHLPRFDGAMLAQGIQTMGCLVSIALECNESASQVDGAGPCVVRIPIEIEQIITLVAAVGLTTTPSSPAAFGDMIPPARFLDGGLHRPPMEARLPR